MFWGLIALYCLCLASRGLYNHHLVWVSWSKLKKLFYDQHGGSEI